MENKPKILIITQKVDINDDNLGSFHDWLKNIAFRADVLVIANYVGEDDLPENVKVFSLGKEKGAGKLTKILKYWWLLLKLLPKSDGVFYHMCPEYVIGAGLWPKIFRKKTLLWYTHKSVNWKLKLAEKLVDKIFTASKESFRLPSRKVEVTGHGIDMDKFKAKSDKRKIDGEKFKIITAGRIAEVKNLHLLIEVAEILKDKNFDFEVKIAGKPILESDKKYFESLKREIKEKKLNDVVEFAGPVPYKNIGDFYGEGDLFVNFSDTGSLDRAVLEAMACGLEILTSNEAFKNILPEESFTTKNSEEVVQKIIHLFNSENSNDLINFVVENHGLYNLIDKINNFYESK